MSSRNLFGLVRRAGSGGRPGEADALSKRDYLRAIDLFRDLPPGDLKTIEEQTEMRTCARGRISVKDAAGLRARLDS